MYAFTRTRGTNTVLVAVNFGDLAQPGVYTDWFSKAPISLGATGSLDIPAHGYRVLVR